MRITRAGVEALVVVWDSFESAARAQAAIHGLASLPLLVVPRLLAEEGEDDQRRKGRDAAAAIGGR